MARVDAQECHARFHDWSFHCLSRVEDPGVCLRYECAPRGWTMDMPHSTKHVYVVWKAGMTNITLELFGHKE